ncbi:hypothetical protein FRB98_009652 [Tulasnella sp. 332]|nr:hypothetical protein FRB98_009652 [Tulasnella sp. 332]
MVEFHDNSGLQNHLQAVHTPQPVAQVTPPRPAVQAKSSATQVIPPPPAAQVTQPAAQATRAASAPPQPAAPGVSTPPPPVAQAKRSATRVAPLAPSAQANRPAAQVTRPLLAAQATRAAPTPPPQAAQATQPTAQAVPPPPAPVAHAKRPAARVAPPPPAPVAHAKRPAARVAPPPPAAQASQVAPTPPAPAVLTAAQAVSPPPAPVAQAEQPTPRVAPLASGARTKRLATQAAPSLPAAQVTRPATQATRAAPTPSLPVAQAKRPTNREVPPPPATQTVPAPPLPAARTAQRSPEAQVVPPLPAAQIARPTTQTANPRLAAQAIRSANQAASPPPPPLPGAQARPPAPVAERRGDLREPEAVPLTQASGLHEPVSNGPFFCRRCRVSHQSFAEYTAHLDMSMPLYDDSSSIQGPTTCILCQETFPTFRMFVKHVAAGHRSRGKHRYSCVDCLLDFHNLIALRKHWAGPEHGMMQGRKTGLIVTTTPTESTNLPTRMVTSVPSPTISSISIPTSPFPPPSPVALNFLEQEAPADEGGEEDILLPEPPFYCWKCRVSHRSGDELKWHLRGSIPLYDETLTGADVTCLRCHTTYPTFNEFAAHVDESYQEKGSHRYACKRCLIDFHNPYVLQAHLESRGHSANQKRRMRTRVTLVNTTDQLNVPPISQAPLAALPPQAPPPLPVLLPAPVPLPYCRRCRIRFADAQAQAEHEAIPIKILGMAPDGTERPRCTICRKSFSSLTGLHLHLVCGIEAHTNSCVTCLLDFHSARGLQEHNALVHSAPAPAPVTTLPLKVGEGSRGSTPGGSRPPPNRPPSPITTLRPLRNNVIRTPADRRRDNNNAERTIEPNPWGLPAVVSTALDSLNPNLGRTTGSGAPPDDRSARNGAGGLNIIPAPRIDDEEWGILWSTLQERPIAPVNTRAQEDSNNNATASSSSSRKTKQQAAVSSHQTPRKSTLSVPCPLCLETATDLTATPCGHAGCLQCLTRSVDIKPECPVCRTPLTLSQLHPLFL